MARRRRAAGRGTTAPRRTGSGRRVARSCAPVPALLVLLTLFVVPGCGGERGAEGEGRPNILLVMWDTVRSDRLGLYGHSAATTPNLQRLASEGRVYEDCRSVAPYTLPSHASLFTGLLPSQHGTGNDHPWLDDRHDTLAERLRAGGYQTFLWSANPHISSEGNFHQGFDVEEHPWDAGQRKRALAIVRDKARGDRSTELGRRLRRRPGPWAIKAAGKLAEERLLRWLARRDTERPWFAFLNYMEAHRPRVPPRRYRGRFLDADGVRLSERVDRSWQAVWSYNFGLREYDEGELAVMRGIYDAALLELDALLGELLAELEARGLREHTIIVVTSDHGEHLGEHHLLGHQYSVYEPVLRVPLVVHDPALFDPGRDGRPVTNADLFPTLLERAGLEAPSRKGVRSLLTEASGATPRPRLAEYLAPFEDALPAVRRSHPGFDPTPWQRRLRALYDGRYKLIWSGDGRHELYDLSSDSGEETNLVEERPELAERSHDRLESFLASLEGIEGSRESAPEISEEHRERLRALGYAEPADEAPRERPESESAP